MKSIYFNELSNRKLHSEDDDAKLPQQKLNDVLFTMFHCYLYVWKKNISLNSGRNTLLLGRKRKKKEREREGGRRRKGEKGEETVVCLYVEGTGAYVRFVEHFVKSGRDFADFSSFEV
ncbi:unnamed protein product [Onchocerca flexuosa]|uniref:Uncharacterized protein n=1 Tax=Onchocerca flexuosa TaxID=387005 RepID=A0A183HVJ6_9BILA|nr:unnamed protein product [Onchocerca flexuosa]